MGVRFPVARAKQLQAPGQNRMNRQEKSRKKAALLWKRNLAPSVANVL
jgi:hypothetical protein